MYGTLNEFLKIAHVTPLNGIDMDCDATWIKDMDIESNGKDWLNMAHKTNEEVWQRVEESTLVNNDKTDAKR